MYPFHDLCISGVGPIEIFGQLPGEKAKTAYPESQIMLAEEFSRQFGWSAALLSDIVEAKAAYLGPERAAQSRMVMCVGIRFGSPYGMRNILDNRR